MATKVYINNKPFEENLKDYFEKNYLVEIVNNLTSFFINNNLNIEVYFYININNNPSIINPLKNNSIKICIIIDEYLKEDYSLLTKFNYIYQAYLTKENLPTNYYHFPLGYGENFKEDQLRKIKDRPYNLFFSGNLHTGRKKFFREFSKLSYLPFFLAHRIQHAFKFKYDNKYKKSIIRFTHGFYQGLTKEVYSDFLYKSKIALCPSGIANIESFRHYEALKAGCVVISDKLPKKLNFEKSPIVQVEDWRHLEKIIRELISDEERLQDLSNKSYIFYNYNFSGEAIAKAIYNNVIKQGNTFTL